MAYDAARSDTLREMRVTLDKLAEQLTDLRGEVATREDLKALVTLAQYNADQRALNDRQQDHAQRLSRLEDGQRGLVDKMHDIEIADIARNGRVTATAQAGQLAAGRATQATQDWIMRLTLSLFGAFLGGFVTLLVFAATHH